MSQKITITVELSDATGKAVVTHDCGCGGAGSVRPSGTIAAQVSEVRTVDDGAQAPSVVIPSGSRVSRVRAICICLPEHPEKIEKAKAHFAAHGLDVEFFWGINAPVAGLSTWHPYEVDHPGSGFRMGAKPTGCWLSHYMLWSAMTVMPDDVFLVLEDDAQLHDGFMRDFEQALRDAPPDFDFLHVGHCCVQGRPMQHVAGNVYECKDQVCTHAYVLHRRAVPFLLSTLRKCWAPIDIQLQREIFPYLKTYVVVPRIASQFDTVIPA